MNYFYTVFSECRHNPNVGKYVGYGINCFASSPFKRSHISSLPDISTDKEFVSNLADLFTRNNLYPCHIEDAVLDAIEDRLCEQNSSYLFESEGAL